MKKCRYCNKILTKRDDEDNWAFKERVYCNHQCYWNHKKIILKGKRPKKMINSNIGRKHSKKSIEKGREKIRKSVKKLWQNSEYRERQIKAHKGKTGSLASNWKGGLTETKWRKRKNTPRKEWNIKISDALKGRKLSKRIKEKIGLANAGKIPLKKTRKKIGDTKRGDKNPNWKGGITSENQKIRDSEEYKIWRLKVYAKDHYTCQKCKKRGGIKLHAHHIYNFSNNKNLRFEVCNGITFCDKCHRKFHKKYGNKNNLKQILEFLK